MFVAQGVVAFGIQALAAVESGTPDLVLLDLTMPVMDGVEVLRRLRADPQWKGLPVVPFTAVGEGYMVEKAVRLGVQDFILNGQVAGLAMPERIARHLPPQ